MEDKGEILSGVSGRYKRSKRSPQLSLSGKQGERIQSIYILEATNSIQKKLTSSRLTTDTNPF